MAGQPTSEAEMATISIEGQLTAAVTMAGRCFATRIPVGQLLGIPESRAAWGATFFIVITFAALELNNELCLS